jgi:hypothetical protein
VNTENFNSAVSVDVEIVVDKAGDDGIYIV